MLSKSQHTQYFAKNCSILAAVSFKIFAGKLEEGRNTELLMSMALKQYPKSYKLSVDLSSLVIAFWCDDQN